MRYSLLLITTASCCLISSYVQAQSNQCRALQSKTDGQQAFVVYSGGTEPLSNNESSPTQIPAGPVDFHVCIPVIPQERGAVGAFNIKIQIYTAGDTLPNPRSPGVRAVQYENNTVRYRNLVEKFRSQHGGPSAYPTIDIADYQNYHGCSQRFTHQIGSEFHVQVGSQRTDDDPFRVKFVFRRDVAPTCDTPQLLAEFIGGFPSFGPTAAVALGRYDPRVEKIIGRRSVILQYDFHTSPPSETQFLTYDLNRIGKDKCLRIEAGSVFGSDRFSSIVGVACIYSE